MLGLLVMFTVLSFSGEIVGTKVLGFPFQDLSQIPAGDYYVQALLNVYTQYHRADGHTVKMPMDQGEGQHWNSSPGTLISEPKKIRIAGASDKPIQVELTKIIPPITPPKDTKYVIGYSSSSHMGYVFLGMAETLGEHARHDTDTAAEIGGLHSLFETGLQQDSPFESMTTSSIEPFTFGNTIRTLSRSRIFSTSRPLRTSALKVQT